MTNAPGREPATEPDSSPGLTRRHLIRTAGTAAWTAPVVVAASAVPVHAANVSDGAAVLRAPDPTFLILPNGDITVISQYGNFGTAAADSMSVTVTITATVGMLLDVDPTNVRDGFSFAEKTPPATGGQTQSLVYTFIKNEPQIPPGPGSLDSRVQFDITHLPNEVGSRAGQGTFVPMVPPPSTAAASQGTYTLLT